MILKMEWIFPTYNYTEKKFVNFRIENIYSGVYLAAFEEFIQFYAPDVVAPYATKYPPVKPRKKRVCRFCKKGFPDTLFRNNAHVIPQFLGNRYLIHNIECDACNLKFGVYETSFADSIGLLRTTDILEGHRNIPKFKNDGLVAYSEKDELGNHKILIEASDPKKAIYNEKEDSIIFRTKKTPYVPLHIMKVLFKIGYSLLGEDELVDYPHLEKIINTSDLDNKLQEYCKVLVFTFPNYFCNPFSITFKKREEFKDFRLPTKIVLVYFGRFMYEFVLLNSSDTFMIKKGETGRVLYTPPYWDINNGMPSQKIIDFSSPQVQYEEEEHLFTFDRKIK